LKQLVKKIINNFFLIFLSGFLIGCSGNYHLSSMYGKTQLVLNKVQLERFNSYLKGEFYSHELNRKVSHNPIMFAISADGTTSLIFSCVSKSTECNPGIYIYQLIKKYSKKTNKEMFIFSLKNKIVWANNNYVVKGNKLNEPHELLTNVYFNLKDNNSANNKFYDFSILPIDDDDFEN
jgi:hypothetical protein